MHSQLQIIAQTYFGIDEKELTEQINTHGLIEYFIDHDTITAEQIFTKHNNYLMLGKLYCDHSFKKEHYTISKQYLEKSVQQGNTHALIELGYMYYYGYGVEKNCSKTKHYFEQAAAQGNARALNNLGEIYYNGFGVEKNELIAKQYFEQSIKQNDSLALVNVGILFNEQNSSNSLHYFTKAPYNALALFELGKMYLHGTGITQNTSTAMELWKIPEILGFISPLQKFHELYKLLKIKVEKSLYKLSGRP